MIWDFHLPHSRHCISHNAASDHSHFFQQLHCNVAPIKTVVEKTQRALILQLHNKTPVQQNWLGARPLNKRVIPMTPGHLINGRTCETSRLSSFTGREELTYIEPLLCARPFIYIILFYSHNNPMSYVLLSLSYRWRHWGAEIEKFAQTHSAKSRGQDSKSVFLSFSLFLAKQTK